MNGTILWANMHLLFWLSLFPFATGWMGENHFMPLPSALYGAVLLMAGMAYYLLQNRIVAEQGASSTLAASIGGDIKGKVSLLFYVAGIVASFIGPFVAGCIYIFVALMWLVPDRRLARVAETER